MRLNIRTWWAVAAFTLVTTTPVSGRPVTITFWNTPRHGANWFNIEPTRDWLVAARDAGITLVRLAPDKWRSAGRDFLIENADRYTGIPDTDLALLKSVLRQADSVGIKIVLCPLSLPGARWKQHNGDRLDPRLWRDSSYLPQVIRFWKDLARELKDYPALAGYDLLNEPVPERAAGFEEGMTDIDSWYRSVVGSTPDLNVFFDKVVSAIREIDTDIPIIIEPGLWGSPSAISYLKPLSDSNVLYSFHFYEPWEYTNFKANGGNIRYGAQLTIDSTRNGHQVTRSDLKRILQPVVDWQQTHHMPSDRILVGEFGCNRRNPGVEHYLADLVQIFNEQNWHWAFYAFREDTWDGMDYELGDKPMGAAYWAAVERGEKPKVRRFDNNIWRVLSRQFIKTP